MLKRVAVSFTAVLKFVITSDQGALRCHFALGPANCAARPTWSHGASCVCSSEGWISHSGLSWLSGTRGDGPSKRDLSELGHGGWKTWAPRMSWQGSSCFTWKRGFGVDTACPPISERQWGKQGNSSILCGPRGQIQHKVGILNKELCKKGMAGFSSNLSSAWGRRHGLCLWAAPPLPRSVTLEKVIRSPEPIFPSRKWAW